MIIRSAELMDKIQDQLTILQARIKISNALGQTDVNKAAEDFYCGLLNIVLGGYHLKNLNLLQMDFPAIDLGDEENRLCVQVTSTEGREKVRSTLCKFFENDLHLKFDRLIVLIIGEKGRYRKDFDDAKPGFDFDHSRDVWDTAKLLQKINALELDRMEAVADYLHTALNIPAAPVPLQLPLHTSLGVDGFIGRQAELESLAQAIQDGAKPILLSGLGGIGKTELASRFGQSYTKGRVYLASFQNSFRDTVTHSIAKGIPNLLEKKLPEDEVYHTVMAQLSQCLKDDILILDNVDHENGSYYDLLDDTYNSLCGLDLRLILTTRFEVAGAIEIKQLSNQELYQIFRKHKVNISAEEMDALIQAVDGHTLTIDLMARTMTGTWKKVTADMLLTALQEKDLPNKDYRRVPTDYNRTNRQERIYEHLRTVFNVAGVPEAARAVLCYATLLPQDGMDVETFGMALQEDKQQALDDLINHGWLAVKDDTLTIHPVVRLVCREELKPSDENCSDFLDAIWDQLDRNHYNAILYQQLAQLFTNASDELHASSGLWEQWAGWFYFELGQLHTALKFNLKAVSKQEALLPPNHIGLTTAYNNLGSTYLKLGQPEQALVLKEKVVKIWEGHQPDEYTSLAISYDNLGAVYCDLGNYTSARDLQLQALRIRLDILQGKDLDLAVSYSNLCYTYLKLGEYQNALENGLNAIAICEATSCEQSPLYASAHNNISLVYEKLKDYDKALYHLQKSTAIREKILPAEHPTLAASYGNLSLIYMCLDDPQKALEYTLKDISISEATLPGNHPDLANSYNSLGCIYSKLMDYEKSLIFFKKALVIQEEQLGPSHPDVAATYNNIGCSYLFMRNYKLAKEYEVKALHIAEQTLPPNHPDLERYRQRVTLFDLVANMSPQ